MSTEITTVARLQTTEIMSTAKAFHESGMFPDIKSAAQAVVKIQAGQEIGIPPFAAMSGIHIIQGKPTIGAGLIASRIKGSGKYDYRIKQQNEKACSIDFFQGKELIGNSTFTLEDAKKAGTKNIDKFARNMLFARAISNGVKWFCPDVFAGPVYTPEDFDVVNTKTEDVEHQEIKIDLRVTPEPPNHSDKEIAAFKTPLPTDNRASDFYEVWQKEVTAMDTISKLSDLYNAHITTVNEDEKLKSMFSKRTAELRPKKQAV
jgi:hypothetical protein